MPGVFASARGSSTGPRSCQDECVSKLTGHAHHVVSKHARHVVGNANGDYTGCYIAGFAQDTAVALAGAEQAQSSCVMPSF